MLQLGFMLWCIVAILWCTLMKKTLSLLGLSYPSAIQKHRVFGRDVYFKRDDSIVNSMQLTGNKGRKFFHLATNPSDRKYYGSYGGTQSNSMFAIGNLAQFHRKQFLYFTDSPLGVPSSVGNFKKSIDGGMNTIHVDKNDYVSASYAEKLPNLPQSLCKYIPGIDPNDVFWIPQGGCFPNSMPGIQTLGSELSTFIRMSVDGHSKWKVIVCSGTGTTALFLSQYFRHNPSVEVLAVPCAGTAAALQAQMQSLNAVSNRLGVYPTVVPAEPKRSFAKPCLDHWTLWNTLRHQTGGIEFDLIYASRCWELLIRHFGDSSGCGGDNSRQYDKDSEALKYAWEGCGVIYYHCGGVEGNESQLARYDKIRKIDRLEQ